MADPGPSAPLEGVTEREREVLTLIGRGLSNREIADALFIGAATAKAHVARMFTKLSAASIGCTLGRPACVRGTIGSG